MIKLLIFDIGGVILDSESSFEQIYGEFGEAIGIPAEKSVMLHYKYLDRMLAGSFSASKFFSVIKKQYGVKGDLMKIWVRVALKHVEPNTKLLKMIDKLRAHYPVVILSNVTETRSAVDKELELYKHFDQVFLSYKLGMLKPSKRIYIYVLRKMKMKPEEALFIDDKEANLKVARELGIKCVQFNNNAQLTTELGSLL